MSSLPIAITPRFPPGVQKVTVDRLICLCPSGTHWGCLAIASFYDSAGCAIFTVEVFFTNTGGGYRPESLSGSEPGSIVFGAGRVDSPPVYTQDDYILLSHGTQVDACSPAPSTAVAPSRTHNESSHELGPFQEDFTSTSPPPYSPYAMAAQYPTRGGWNPRYGWDAAGGPPNGMTPAGMAPSPGAGMTHLSALTGTYYTMPNLYPYHTHFPAQLPLVPTTYFHDPNARGPAPHPTVTSDFPGMNMVNSTGGSGCEPGYNYMFHNEHTKVHVFRTAEPPWRTNSMCLDFAKFQIPTNTTIAELMARFGAANPVAKLNRMVEVIEGGNGKWYRGRVISGDNDVEMGKTLKQIGWDETRSGREKPVVWLWITKD